MIGDLGEFALKKCELNGYQKEALDNPDEFWGKLASRLTWTKPWDKIMDLSDAPITKWFTGGELNMCYECVDKHIQTGFGDKEILLCDSPVTGTRETYTYNEIFHEVTHLAGVLKEYGVEKGDKVLIYMPLIAEGIFSMLASCRLGAIQCAMPNGLPAQDLATRINHFKPKIILMASNGYHANGWVNYKTIIDEACTLAQHKPDKILVFKHQEKTPLSMMDGRDDDWSAKVKNAEPVLECTPVEATQPIFVVYTSGSTGTPKGVVHALGGYAVKLVSDSRIETDSDNETLYFPTNFGWIAGQSILVYMPLMMKHKSVIYEGDVLLTSDVSALYKLIESNGVTRLCIRPGILKIIKSMDPEGKTASQFNLTSIRDILFGGERVNKATAEWAADIFNTTIWNIYGQTELSSFVCSGVNHSSDKPVKRIFDTSFPCPGLIFVVRKADGSTAKPRETGRLLIKLPLPPGGLVSLWNEHEKCKALYFEEFPGYFDTKDDGYIDENGAIHVEGRVDLLMKHGLVYLSSEAVEEAVTSHPEVGECVVISTPHLILKEVPVTLYTTKNGNNMNLEKTSNEILEILSEQFGDAVTFGKIIQVKSLPKTSTGKINRASIAALVKGLDIQPIGVANPECLRDISVVLDEAGYINTKLNTK